MVRYVNYLINQCSLLLQKKDPNNPYGRPIPIRWPRGTKSDSDKLHMAVMSGKMGQLQNLVKSGIPVDIRNKEGQTGLFVAATMGNSAVVTALLSMGANPNARCDPEGCTPLHGACYIGSVPILRRLLLNGGDLRLTDTKRQKPEDWICHQVCPDKRKAIRYYVEQLRLSAMQMTVEDMMKSMDKFGRSLSFGRTMWNTLTKCGGREPSRRKDHSQGLNTLGNINPSGFGKIYFDRGTKCSETIRLPCISEATDLKYDSNPKAPSWICGKFSTFVPMFWHGRNTSVTTKALRRKSVEESVPDILISELNMLGRLQHPQILMVLAVCQEENFDSLSLVFEKIQLGSLYYFLHQQNFRMKSSFATDIVSLRMYKIYMHIHIGLFL